MPMAEKAVVVNGCAGKSWQRWTYDSATAFVRSLQNPNMCLSHGNASQAQNGGAVSVQLCSDSNDHRWVFNDGVLRNIYNTNIVLDAFGDNDGATVGQWSYHGGNNQRWSWGQY